MSTPCHEVVRSFSGDFAGICEAVKGTEHSHSDGFTLRYLNEHDDITPLDTIGCQYLADGTRALDHDGIWQPTAKGA